MALLAVVTQFSDIRLSLPFVLGGVGIVASLIGIRFKLAKWWGPILLLLPIALGTSLYFPVPPWVYLACFAVLVIIYWNAAGERVPLYLTNTRTWATIETLVGQDAKKFADLGCGVGGGLLYLGRQHPDMIITGIESAPVPYVISKLRVRLLGLENIHIRFGDMWTEDLADYDAVYAFLSPEPMSRLYQKVKSEMRTGTTFISNSFAVEGHEPDDIVHVDDSRKTKLLIWKF